MPLAALTDARHARPVAAALVASGAFTVNLRMPADVIDDVVASGSSAARAIQALLAETSLRIAGVQSIANWGFPEMRALLAPWPVRALTSYPQVLASAQETRMISPADASQLMRFYADPRRHNWNLPDGGSPRAAPM